MPHLLLVTQVYLPDPASVGQHMADSAEEMVRRGWQVTVLTSARGYDNPAQVFPAHEKRNGVNIIRLPFSSFGKKTLVHRLSGQSLFCIQAILRGLFLLKIDAILVTTSPPIGGLVGWFISLLRRVPFHFWVMDLNPDQAIQQGIVSATSLPARVFDFINHRLLHRASTVIPMDHFMADRLAAKVPSSRSKMHIIAPWPMEDSLEIIPKDDNPFIREHALEGKFLIMYSGNHSVVHPLDTILEAALALQERTDLLFVFIGGGKGKAAIDKLLEEKAPRNILSLPYQALDRIKYSLSAADIHLVSMGAPMVGCVHPCKFYGAMSLAKPILYLGPENSHIGELLEEVEMGWQVNHGDPEMMIETIKSISALPKEELLAYGQRGKAKIEAALSRQQLCETFCEIISGTDSATSKELRSSKHA